MHIISSADYRSVLKGIQMNGPENKFKPSPTLTGSPGLVLLATAKLFSSKSAHTLDDLHIKTRHLIVMQILAEKENPTQVRVGSRLRIDRTTMVKTIDDLEKAGLAARTEKPSDRRCHGLELTDRGRQTLTAGLKRMHREENIFFATLSNAEERVLKAFLLRLLYQHFDPTLEKQLPKRKHHE